MESKDKLFCFRFDVDTESCIRIGMPRLMELAKKLDVRFTFFVNMGRAVSRRASLVFLVKRFFDQSQRRNPEPVSKLSSVTKLGMTEFLKTALLNPRVGLSHIPVIRHAKSRGHEIGLHGGRNHGEWMKEIHKWPAARIHHEVETGLQWLHRASIGNPKSFSSPGWQSDERLGSILSNLGFTNICDHYGENSPAAIVDRQIGIVKIGTNLVGEPGGVGYLEWHRAKGHDDHQILEHVGAILKGKNIAIVYDHPVFAGIKDIAMVEKIIRYVRSMGYAITTIGDISDRVLTTDNA